MIAAIQSDRQPESTGKLSSRSSGVKISFGLLVSVGVSALLVAMLSLSAHNLQAEARYLPTRADESSVEVLRDLIKGLLVQSKMEQLEQQSAGLRFAQQELEPSYGRGAGGRQPTMQQPIGSEGRSLQTRAVEIAQESQGDSAAALLRSMGGAAGSRLLGKRQSLD